PCRAASPAAWRWSRWTSGRHLLLGVLGGGRGELRADLALLAAQTPLPYGFVGDDDGEDDQALHDRGDPLLVRPRGRVVEGGRGLVEEGPQQGGEGDAARVVAAEQGDADGGEAEAGREVEAVGVGVAEQQREAREAGDGAGDQHGDQDHALGV